MDRVEELTVLDVDGTPPAQARVRDLGEGVFTPSAEDLVVTLRLAPGATWVSDYYPVESVAPAEGGGQVVTLRTGDTAWLRRLMWRLGGRAVVLEPATLAAEVAGGAPGRSRPTPASPRRAERMLPWWGWVVLWATLALGATAVIAWRLRRLWHRFTALLDEVEAAERALTTLEQRAGEARSAADRPAVGESPWRMADEYATLKDAARRAGASRRAERLPAWARPRNGSDRGNRT